MSHKPARKKTESYAPEMAVVETIITGIFKGIWLVLKALFGVAGNKKTGAKSGGIAEHQQLRALQEHWESVEMHLMQETTMGVAISEADKLLDAALQIKRVPGETMGERLKASEHLFPGDLYQEIWQAHKLRNSLAHEVGVRVGSEQARGAVGIFRKALYQLGVL